MKRVLFIGLCLSALTIAFAVDDVYYWRGDDAQSVQQKQSQQTQQYQQYQQARPVQTSRTEQTAQPVQKTIYKTNSEQNPDTVKLIIRK